MRIISLIFVAGVLGRASGHSVNYCGAKMCQHTNAHTFCQFPAGPSVHCTGYVDAPLTNEEKIRIIARLNRRRSDAANGKIRNMPPAGNMVKLRWMEELAREAQRWADQCRPPDSPEEQDTCRDLYAISVGQCVGSVIGEAPGLRPESFVDVWYMQGKSYKKNVTYYVEPYQNIGFYGDFAQIMWANTYMVGCGRSRFMLPWRGRLRTVERLVCNFAPRGPEPSKALWYPATPTSACPPRSRPDPKLNALCSYQYHLDETDDTTGVMSFKEHVLLNIVLEIERNGLLDYQGSLDEFYLTKMAAATIVIAGATSSLYNSHQKRDIIEPVKTEALLDDVAQSFTDDINIINVLEPTTTKLGLNTTKNKRKSLIGRPKCYNMEELNDIGDLETKSTREITKQLPIDEKNIYAEYDFTEASEEDLFASTLPLQKTQLTSNDNDNNILTTMATTLSVFIESISTETWTNKTENTTIYIEVNDTEEIRVDDVNMWELINAIAFIGLNITNSSLKEKDMESYLSDPETVRELQEALDRMEHSIANTTATGKVRRDIREFAKDGEDHSVGNDVKKPTDTGDNESEPDDNETDKTPMLNMVLKYMPYIKPHRLLGKNNPLLFNEGCHLISSSITLVFMLFLCF